MGYTREGGQQHLNKPVFNTVKEAVNEVQANTSIIFVPAGFAADAIMEAADSDKYNCSNPKEFNKRHDSS